jgi:putative glycerol-1-phosphate prenyltransferase
MFRFPVVYLEYSGKLGDRNLVREIRSRLKQSRLFYGGGIANAEAARQMAEAADTIVVGNAIYDDLKAALSTVEAVKNGRV